jgi:hypothetical protein
MKILVPNSWKKSPIWENICQHYGHNRLMLPEFSIEDLFPGFSQMLVTIKLLPQGDWSANLIDQIVLTKFAVLLQPQTILEVGSFRGYTARMLAENTSPETIIYTLDINPNHGEAYRNTPLENRIKRYITPLSSSTPQELSDIKFDFIFLDADHRREAVEHDTKILFSMLSENGILFWHDYADWGWMSGQNGVPEALSVFAREKPILSVPGTNLAVYRQGWTENAVNSAIEKFV